VTKGSKTVIAIASLAFFTGSLGFAIAAPAKTTTIYACLSSSGNLSKVSTKSTKCPTGTSKLSWNQSGSAGQQGAPGARGAQGLPGVQGIPGKAAPSFEVTVVYSSNAKEKSGTTTLSGRFVDVDGALWPLVWGSGVYVPEFGAFRTNASEGELVETLAFPGLSCSGTPHAIIGVRNNVDVFGEEEVTSSAWFDDLPPIPLNNEVRTIRGEYFKVSENTFDRESIRSFRDDNGFCRTGKPFDDLYKIGVYENQIVDYDEWDEPIYQDVLVRETPLFFVKVQLIESAPVMERTAEILEYKSR